MILVASKFGSRFLFLKYPLLWFFVLLLSSSVYSQDAKLIDPLLHRLNDPNISKTERARVLSKIAYNHPSPLESLNYAKESLKIATQIDDVILQAEAWEEISHVERRLGNNTASFDASLQALSIYEKEEELERQAASYVQIASNYITDEDYPTAISYLKKATTIYSQNSKDLNLALTMINLGEAYRLSNQLDSSSVYLKKAIELNGIQNNQIVFGYASGNLGMVQGAQNNTIEAKENLQRAIDILSKEGDPYSTSVYIAELGTIHQKELNFTGAASKFHEALSIAEKSNLKEQIRDVSALLSSLYEDQKNFDKALTYQKKFQVYQDSLINKKNIQQLEQLKAGYEIGQRESEILRLNEVGANRKRITIGLIIGICVLGLFMYLIYRANKRLSRQKEVIEAREKEKALLLRELNHRVKNNLQMISSLLNLQSNELSGHPAEEALITGQYRVEALSLVHRKLYQEGVESKVELKEYVEELVLGLFHSYHINFAPEIDIADLTVGIDTAVPLALIINELITNAIKYAFNTNETPSLKVTISKIKDQIELEIVDNGPGFTEKERSKSNSLGLKLVTSLATQLGGDLQLLDYTGTHWKLLLQNKEIHIDGSKNK